MLKLRLAPDITIRTFFTEVSNKTLPKPLKLRNESFFAKRLSSNMPKHIQSFDSPYLKTAKNKKYYNQLKDVGKDIQEDVENNINQYSALLIKNLPYTTPEEILEI